MKKLLSRLLGIRKKKLQADLWSLDMTLGMLSPRDPWRLSDAVMGTLALGSTGSGKTSGGIRWFTRAFLAAGFGGLVLTVKPEDRHDIEAYARALGRLDDLVIFEPRGSHKFNLLEFELRHGGGEPASRLENAVQLFKVAIEMAERDRGKGGYGDNKYFERAAMQKLRNAKLAMILAQEPITLGNVHKFITSAPQSLAEANSSEWRGSSYCYQVLCRADDQQKSESLLRDFELSLHYWMREWPSMDPKPRSGVMSTYTSMADVLQRGEIRELFFGETTITPDACRDGKIFVVDFPTLRWNDVGRILQSCFKYVWQRAAERCDVSKYPRPVFLISDEAQQFLTSFDAPFQATARSSRVCTLYATQNLPGMIEAVGGESARHSVDALLGNLRTKVFCAQDDPFTCEWQSSLIGKTKRMLFNCQMQNSPMDYLDFFKPRKQQSAGFSESFEYEVHPWEWSRNFRMGGPQNNFLVDAVVFQGGRVWDATGKTYLPTVFSQQ